MKTLSSLALLIAAAAAALASPLSGKVLLLENEVLIEGDIRREGDFFIVKQGMGETVMPAAGVIGLFADRTAAYQSMRQRCNRRDYDDRLHLIRWCAENGLRREALQEAESLLPFRPEDSTLQRLVENWRDAREAGPAAEEASTAAAAPPKSQPVLETEPLDYNREAYPLFVAKVQPILMNLCARCHATGQGGSYSLIAAPRDGDRKATLNNLAATIKQLKRSNIDSSPLLVKAVSAHGKSSLPPLHDRQAPAFQYLDAWAHTALTPTEELSEAVARPLQPVVKPTSGESKPTLATVFAEKSTTQTVPEPQTEARDPFDPAIFNGTIQPKRE